MLASLHLVLLLAACVNAVHDRVHAFYYLWYRTPAHDGAWAHWNHSVLPHWTASITSQFPATSYRAPWDIHAPFYPSRGPYSSLNRSIVAEHLGDMAAHGVGVVILSWWGRPPHAQRPHEGDLSTSDSQGVNTDDGMMLVMDVAGGMPGVRVALHLEPYPGRSVDSVAADLLYLKSRLQPYAHVMYTLPRTVGGVPVHLPVFFVYDSYHIPPREWARLLTPQGDATLRGSDLDAVFIGLWLEAPHGQELAQAGFDGAYTYFASDGFSYGSSTRNWASMAAFLAGEGMHFMPSVGPGYDDTRIRPWNAANTRGREGGAYYERMWAAALQVRPAAVGITTFNEWGEGTQIEDAIAMRVNVDALAPAGMALDHGLRAALRISNEHAAYPQEPGYFLLRTLAWSREFAAATGDERMQRMLTGHWDDFSSPDWRARRQVRMEATRNATLRPASVSQAMAEVNAFADVVATAP